jgi:putative heme-binding domain-containing protein
LIGANHSEAELVECLTLIAATPDRPPTARFHLLAGLGDGMSHSGSALEQLLRNPPTTMRVAAEAIVNALPELRRAASDRILDTAVRLAALRALVRAEANAAGLTVSELMRPHESAEIQSGAVRAFAELADESLARNVFEHSSTFSAALRRKVSAAALQSPGMTAALVDALESGSLAAVELDPPTIETLRKSQNAALRSRLDKLLPKPNPDRAMVFDSLKASLELHGDRRRGAAVYQRVCVICHAVGKHLVGPDLATISGRTGDRLLTDIVDPSREVSPDFVSYTITTISGETLTGLIAAESATGVTIRRPSLADETILRSQIKDLRAEGKSLMPEGLEAGLTPQDLADLIAFVREPDAAFLAGE